MSLISDSLGLFYLLYSLGLFYFDKHGLALVAVADELHEALVGAAVYKTLLKA